jgi:HEAT repeat protein
MRKNLWRVTAAVAVSALLPAGAASRADEAPANKEALRYDGKSFDYWQGYVTTELKTERLIEGVRAMRAFGTKGYGRPAAEAIVGIVKDHRKAADKVVDPQDPEIKLLLEAAEAVTSIGRPALDVLMREWKHPDVREFAEAAIKSSSEEFPLSADSARTLLQAVEGDAPELRKGAVKFLGQLLHDTDGKQPAIAAALSGGHGDGVVRAALAVLDQSEGDEYLTINVLFFLGPQAKAAIPALVKYRLRTGSNLGDTLAKIGADAGALVPLVAAGLKDPQPEVRYRAAAWLGEFGPAGRGTVPAVIEGLKDSDPSVRLKAIEVLGLLADPEKTVPALVRIFSDRREFREHRIEAALALAKFGREAKSALPELLKSFTRGVGEEGRQMSELQGRAQPSFVAPSPPLEKGEEKETSVRCAAIRAAARIGEPRQLIPSLVKVLESELGDKAAATIKAVASEGKLPPLMPVALSGNSSQLTECAVAHLVRVNPTAEEALPVLVRVLKRYSGETDLRSQIIQALGRMGPSARDALPAIWKAANEPDLRETAIAAAEKIVAKPEK